MPEVGTCVGLIGLGVRKRRRWLFVDRLAWLIVGDFNIQGNI
jgi:hypothetical protein